MTLSPHWSIANSIDDPLPHCVLQNSLWIGRDLNSPVCYFMNELCSLVDVFCLPFTSSWNINHPLIFFLSSYHNLTWHWRRLNYREYVECPPLFPTAWYNCRDNLPKPPNTTPLHSLLQWHIVLNPFCLPRGKFWEDLFEYWLGLMMNIECIGCLVICFVAVLCALISLTPISVLS